MALKVLARRCWGLILGLLVSAFTNPVAAQEPLPMVLTAAELASGKLHFRSLQRGQALELLGFAQVDLPQHSAAARLQALAPEHYQLRMPARRDYLAVDYLIGTQAGRLQLFLQVPIDTGADRIDHYVVGRYPPVADRGLPYRAPAGLIAVTDFNRQRLVSPNFQLGQFLCKQEAQWPKYIALQTPLLAKLERLLAQVRARGFAARTLQVMSGYRTPHYNRRLGNVPHSRHVYGDAADVFIDANDDGWMDDLNGDGLVDVQDALWLMALLERPPARSSTRIETAEQALPWLEGGLSAYPATAHHGPFLHIDTRGTRARWGHTLDYAGDEVGTPLPQLAVVKAGNRTE